MSKRKREIKQGDPAAPGLSMPEGESDLPAREPAPPLKTARRAAPSPRGPGSPGSEAPPPPQSLAFSAELKENILLGVLILYVIMLGLGTAGELFEVDWILELPFFR